jgi:hypothetical protein
MSEANRGQCDGRAPHDLAARRRKLVKPRWPTDRAYPYEVGNCASFARDLRRQACLLACRCATPDLTLIGRSGGCEEGQVIVQCSVREARRWCVAGGLHCHEQHLAGQGGRGGQGVEEEPARDGIVAYRPQQQAVVPGQIPGGVDRPGGGQAGHRS